MFTIFITLFTSILFVVYYFVTKKDKYNKNPFLNRQQIDEVPQTLKETFLKSPRFNVKHLKETTYDYVIIGSGISGLVTANILAKANKKVLVLESHDRFGGCMHTFKDKGSTWDTGIHYVGQIDTENHKTLLSRLLKELTSDRLEWNHLEDEYDRVLVYDANIDFTIPKGKIAFKNKLNMHFPSQIEAIDKYFQFLEFCRKNAYQIMWSKTLPLWMIDLTLMIPRSLRNKIVDKYFPIYKFTNMSLENLLDKHCGISDPKLKLILSYHFGDYGTPPKTASAFMHASLQNHFMQGVSYPKHGTDDIPFYLLQTLKAHGGEYYCNALVTEIEMGRQKGLPSHLRSMIKVLKWNGNPNSKKHEHVIYAENIVSSIGVRNTIELLKTNKIPKTYRMNHVYDIKHQPAMLVPKQGYAGYSLYVQLKNLPPKFKGGQNIWYYSSINDFQYIQSTLDHEDEKGYVFDTRSLLPNILFVSFPSSKENKRDTCVTCEIITMIPNQMFEKHGAYNNDGFHMNNLPNQIPSGKHHVPSKDILNKNKDYAEKKYITNSHIIEHFLKMTNLSPDNIISYFAGTPNTNQYYLRAINGEFYGLDHNTERFSLEVCPYLRPETKHPNLFMTGQDVMTGGFMGAASAGLLTSSVILNRNLVKDLNQCFP